MSTVFHHPKRKTYYHRSIIPRRLQSYFKGREQLWRSLKTGDKDEATLKSAQWTARIQRLFLTLRKQGDRMTDEQREALVSHWLEVELDEAEDARTLAGPLSDDYREGVWHVLSDQMDEAHEALVTNNWRKVEREADALLLAAGLAPVDHEGAEFGRLCRQLLLAKQEYLQFENERWKGVCIRHTLPQTARSRLATRLPLRSLLPALYPQAQSRHHRANRFQKWSSCVLQGKLQS